MQKNCSEKNANEMFQLNQIIFEIRSLIEYLRLSVNYTKITVQMSFMCEPIFVIVL
jgi:hypothetical protein